MIRSGTKHFHVYLGGTHGFMHGAADFDTAPDSIDAFLGMYDSMLHGVEVETPRALTETALYHAAEEDDNEAIFIDIGRVRLLWVVCTDVCLKYVRN